MGKKSKKVQALPAGLSEGCRVVIEASEGQLEERGKLLSDSLDNGTVLVQVKKSKGDDGLRECPVELVSPVKGKPSADKPAKEERPVFRSVHADLPQREPVWSERRIAVVTVMRELGAKSEGTAVTAGEIAAKAGIEDVYRVKVHLDIYRQHELTHNSYARTMKGGRSLKYYLTQKGLKCKMTPPAEKGEEGTEE
jgi:hypothetical protein